MKDRELTGELVSDNPELDLGMKFRLGLDDNGYKIHVNGDIQQVDLKGLHFMPENMSFSFGLNVDAELRRTVPPLYRLIFQILSCGTLPLASWGIWILLSPACPTRPCWMSRRET